MERPSLRRQLVMIFLGIAIPIGILLGLLLFFQGFIAATGWQLRHPAALICLPQILRIS